MSGTYEIVQRERSQSGIADGQLGQRLDGLAPDGHELVLKSVDEGPTGADAHHAHRVRVELFAGFVVSPFGSLNKKSFFSRCLIIIRPMSFT